MGNYKELGRLKRKHQSALTRAKNSGDPNKVIAACNAAEADWDKLGMAPENWSLWERARNDAMFTKGLAGAW